MQHKILLALCSVVFSPVITLTPAQQIDTIDAHRNALAQRRPVSRRTHARPRRRSQPAECLLHRRGERRCVEDHRLRPHLAADLRSSSRPARSAPSRLRPPIRNIVYVGSGEGLHRPDLSVGDGIYKSTDAGTTWTHLGLRDGQQISQMAIDPHDPNRLFVAVAGHPYGPNPERGIYRSTDGGQTLPEGSLQGREHRRATTSSIDPSDPNTVYATLWEAREGPWENGAVERHRRRHLQVDRRRPDLEAARRRPARRHRRRPTSAIAPSNPKRLFAVGCDRKIRVELYRSDDAGATWSTATTDSASQDPHRRRRSARCQRRSQESRHRLHRQHRDLEVDGWRQDLDRLPRRARRRRLPEHLDQSQQSQHHHARQRSGRDHHA